jgi:hypothetical protein
MDGKSIKYVLKTSEMFPLDHEAYDQRQASLWANPGQTLRPEFFVVYDEHLMADSKKIF